MKRYILTIFKLFLFVLICTAQSPEAFKYQAVVRDAGGQIITNQAVNFRINILQSSAAGSTIYSETHAASTNDFGLVNLEIGAGTVVSGDFTSIAWDADLYFVQVEVDASGGNNFQILGTSQLLSVPYALHAKTAQSVPGDDDSDPSNELQTIGLSGTDLSISNGNTVNLSSLQDGVMDADADPTNEIQSLSISGNSLSISGANVVDLSGTGQPSVWSSSGSDIYYNNGNVGIGTTTPESKLHLSGDFYMNSGLGAFLIGFPNNGNRWRVSTLNSGENLLFRSKPDGSNTYTTRVVFGQDGNVGIGNNTSPDEELVIGSNLGSGWDLPAITVGGTTGGAIEAGNSDYKISMESSSTFNRARITAISPAGFGEGEIEMLTDGLAIGEDVGSPGTYMLKVEHGSFGVNFARAGTDNDWEILTGVAASSNLNLYANGAFRGAFSGADGSWNPSSDRSLKTDVRPMEKVLSNLMQLKPSRYKYIHNNPKNSESLGFIAQEVRALFPEMVLVVEDERSKGLHAMNYAGMSVVAIKAIQEQQEIIENQQTEIDELKTRLEAIEAALLERSK